METFSKNRIEALTDGVYAVAITLLVLDLKVPDAPAVISNAQLLAQLASAIPKLISWFISLAFLMLFWVGTHRLFHRLRLIDARILLLTIVHLALVCLAPFVVAVYGAHILTFAAQALYSLMLAGFALSILVMCEYAAMHPDLLAGPVSAGRRVATRLRLGSLIGCAGLSTLTASMNPDWFGPPFSLLVFSGMLARRLERRIDAARAPKPRV
jgi:uncharacterized membrane protein